MERIESILVIIERGAEAYPEIERAAELAEVLPARLHLLVREYHAVLYWHYLFGHKGDKMSQAAYEREAQAWVDEQVKALADRGLEADGEAVWARNLYSAVEEKVAALQPDLVIKGARGESASGPVSQYSSTDWQLMRRCPVPVLLTRQQTRALQGAIISAVHPAHPDAAHHPLDHRIMDLGTLLAERLGRPLHLFNSFETPASHAAPPMAIDPGLYEEYLTQAEKDHHQALNDFIARYGLPDANVHREEGDPADHLAALAERLPASLVIMGVVSRSALPDLLVGHTAARVLDRLECDVLAVKPPSVVGVEDSD